MEAPAERAGRSRAEDRVDQAGIADRHGGWPDAGDRGRHTAVLPQPGNMAAERLHHRNPLPRSGPRHRSSGHPDDPRARCTARLRRQSPSPCATCRWRPTRTPPERTCRNTASAPSSRRWSTPWRTATIPSRQPHPPVAVLGPHGNPVAGRPAEQPDDRKHRRPPGTRNEVLVSMLGKIPTGGAPGRGDRRYFMERRGDGVPISRTRPWRERKRSGISHR